jgi:ACS family hexuronate transporter-like MFS transporter
MAQGKTARVLEGLKSGHLRWPILLMLFLATVVNYLDRQVFSVLAPILSKTLSLNDAQYAWIITAFNAGTILGLIFAGPFIDRMGSRIGFALAIVIWSIGGGLTALAASVTALALYRFILGLGESGNWPASSKAVAEWFPAKERALAMGFFNGGVSIGAIFAVPLVFLLVRVFGSWRWAFVFTASLAIPWLFFWLKLYYPAAQHPRISREERELIERDRIKSSGTRIHGVLKTKPFWGIFLARSVTSPVWFFISYWIFKYLNTQFGFNLSQMAAVAWIPFVFADIGNIAGGYLSGKLIARGLAPDRARKTMMAIGAAMMTANILTAFTHRAGLALALICWLTLAWGIWVSNMLGLVSDTFASREVGTVMSWTGLGQYAGSSVFTLFTGYALKWGAGYAPVFLVAGALPLIGLIFTFTLNRETTAKSESLPQS